MVVRLRRAEQEKERTLVREGARDAPEAGHHSHRQEAQGLGFSERGLQRWLDSVPLPGLEIFLTERGAGSDSLAHTQVLKTGQEAQDQLPAQLRVSGESPV